mgnify:CR=1 FL=1
MNLLKNGVKYMWPTIIQKDETGKERVYDLPSRLLKDRIVLLAEEVNTNSAMSVISQLLFLESEDANAPITMYINSPGGSVSDGMAIYDVMNKGYCPILLLFAQVWQLLWQLSCCALVLRVCVIVCPIAVL